MEKRTWKLTPDQRHRAVWRYRSGERLKVIAFDYGVTTRAINKLAHARGFARREIHRMMPRA